MLKRKTLEKKQLQLKMEDIMSATMSHFTMLAKKMMKSKIFKFSKKIQFHQKRMTTNFSLLMMAPNLMVDQ
jgi:hypothetical protein